MAEDLSESKSNLCFADFIVLGNCKNNHFKLIFTGNNEKANNCGTLRKYCVPGVNTQQCKEAKSQIPNKYAPEKVMSPSYGLLYRVKISKYVQEKYTNS
jgi:hypothetical protein